jgi:glycosyltransferase involved in cell wall biosynthesis
MWRRSCAGGGNRGPVTSAAPPQRHRSRPSRGLDYEIVVVEDSSPDGTYEVALQLQSLYGSEAVKILKRPGKMGLGSAYIDGLKLATGDFVFIMDADLSHHVRRRRPTRRGPKWCGPRIVAPGTARYSLWVVASSSWNVTRGEEFQLCLLLSAAAGRPCIAACAYLSVHGDLRTFATSPPAAATRDPQVHRQAAGARLRRRVGYAIRDGCVVLLRGAWRGATARDT